MNFLGLNRIIRSGITDFRRNLLLSVAATAIMAITLFVISSLFLARGFTKIALDSVQDKVDISVYFEISTSEQTIGQIQRQVELLPEVKSIEYVPPAEARERFREQHKNEPLLLESIDQFTENENPFPASFAIKVNDLNDYQTIISLFQDKKFDPFVSQITDKQQVVDRLRGIISGISNAGLLATLALSFITVLVMFNTVRLTIYNRRGEIEIMKLVGASNAYIRGPFLVSGVLYAAAGTIISSAIVFPALYYFGPKILAFLGAPSGLTYFLGFNIWLILAGQLLFGIILGVISSLIAMGRYLKI